MNDDILKLYKSIGTNQDASTSMTPVKSHNAIVIDDDSSLVIPSAGESKLAKYKDQLNQQIYKISPRQTTNFYANIANEYHQKNTYLSSNNNATSSSSSLKRQNDSLTDNLSKRKREKCSKGLRHFSMKVCEKVKQKGVTTYNEVADELVHEYCNSATSEQTALDYWSYDQKNVRRRVYDALNVLMAMNIISKEKKEIKWIGLPCNKKQECQELELEKQKKADIVKAKCEQLKDLILEQIAFKSLVERNKNSSQDKNDFRKKLQNNTINTPFIIVSTEKKTIIDCNISTDKKEYLLNFDNTFEINSHVDLLKRMGCTMGLEAGACTNKIDLQNACQMVPKLFEPYVKQMATSTQIKPITFSPTLPNFKNLAKNDNHELKQSKDDYNDLNDNMSLDEQGDFSGIDSDQSDSDDNSLIDSSS